MPFIAYLRPNAPGSLGMCITFAWIPRRSRIVSVFVPHWVIKAVVSGVSPAFCGKQNYSMLVENQRNMEQSNIEY